MDDSRRPSKWQDDAVQAADTHRGLAARGLETEKKRRRPEERKVREDQQPQKERITSTPEGAKGASVVQEDPKTKSKWTHDLLSPETNSTSWPGLAVLNVVDKDAESVKDRAQITPSTESPYDRKNPIPKVQGLEDRTRKL